MEALDPATLAAVVGAMLEDVEDIQRRAKGKGRADDAPHDFDLALSAYKQDLSDFALLEADRAMCVSISNAVEADQDIIALHIQEEHVARRDREIAMRLQGASGMHEAYQQHHHQQQQQHMFAGSEPTTPPEMDIELLARLAALNVVPNADGELDKAGSSSRPGFCATGTCTACSDDFPSNEMSSAPCGHEYCGRCVVTLFTNSLTDHSLFPPRCCGQAMPLEQNRRFINPKLAGKFHAKKLELETPNPTYCYDSICSTFIPPQFIYADVAACVRCHKRTCAVCKTAAHVGDCPDDPRTKQLLDLAAAEGWRQCNSCRSLVELNTGCYHMTCRCTAQFCYLCGNTWKTCTCAQWDERHLINRAEQIVDRMADLDPEQRARRVAREVQNQARHHGCDHGTWERRAGSAQCEQCHDHLRAYIFECVRCRVRACHRCRFNRM